MRPGADLLKASPYTHRLRARLTVEDQLIDDATARDWTREVERHQATRHRLEQLLHDLGDQPTPTHEPGPTSRRKDPPNDPTTRPARDRLRQRYGSPATDTAAPPTDLRS